MCKSVGTSRSSGLKHETPGNSVIGGNAAARVVVVKFIVSAMQRLNEVHWARVEYVHSPAHAAAALSVPLTIRIWGLWFGFGVWGLGFVVWALWFVVCGLGVWVDQGSGTANLLFQSLSKACCSCCTTCRKRGLGFCLLGVAQRRRRSTCCPCMTKLTPAVLMRGVTCHTHT